MSGELHGRAGRQAALLDRPVGCTLSWAVEKKGWAEGYPFLQAGPTFSATRRTAVLCSPSARPSVFCAARQKLTLFIWKHGPPISVSLSTLAVVYNYKLHSF